MVSFQALQSTREVFSLHQPSVRMHSEGYGTWFVCLCVCVCVCLSAPFWPLRVKVSPQNDTNASSQQDKDNKTGDFLKNAPFKVMASFAHFVGVRQSCRALQFILTVTEAAIATKSLTVS